MISPNSVGFVAARTTAAFRVSLNAYRSRSASGTTLWGTQVCGEDESHSLPISRIMGTMVTAVARVPRLSLCSRFSELVDGWLFQLGATKPAANTLAAYRRDL